MIYSLFDKTTRQVTGRIACDDQVIALYDTETHGYVEGEFTSEEGKSDYWIDENGEPQQRTVYHDQPVYASLIETTQSEIVLIENLPPDAWVVIRPVGRMKFYETRQKTDDEGRLLFTPVVEGTYAVKLIGQYKGGPYQIEALTIDTLKQRRCDEVNALKDAKITQGVFWNEHRWQVDANSQAALRSYLGLPLPDGFFFTDYDNHQVPLDETELAELAQAMSNFSFGTHARARALKDQINNSTDFGWILALNLDTDWP